MGCSRIGYMLLSAAIASGTLEIASADSRTGATAESVAISTFGQTLMHLDRVMDWRAVAFMDELIDVRSKNSFCLPLPAKIAMAYFPWNLNEVISIDFMKLKTIFSSNIFSSEMMKLLSAHWTDWPSSARENAGDSGHPSSENGHFRYPCPAIEALRNCRSDADWKSQYAVLRKILSERDSSSDYDYVEEEYALRYGEFFSDALEGRREAKSELKADPPKSNQTEPNQNVSFGGAVLLADPSLNILFGAYASRPQLTEKYWGAEALDFSGKPMGIDSIEPFANIVATPSTGIKNDFTINLVPNDPNTMAIDNFLFISTPQETPQKVQVPSGTLLKHLESWIKVKFSRWNEAFQGITVRFSSLCSAF